MHAPESPDRPQIAPLWLLALVTFSGTLGMHIFVPALPFAATDLGASIGEMQLTVSLYILGLAVGQLVYGPLSDRFGRRPTLMVGLVLYTLAGLAAAFAPEVDSLIAARLFQALGGCAGMVLGRAIVRDTSTPEASAQRLALLSLIVSVGPGSAPIIGSAGVHAGLAFDLLSVVRTRRRELLLQLAFSARDWTYWFPHQCQNADA